MSNDEHTKKQSAGGRSKEGRIPEIPVLYEDESCAVIDKPAGIMVHGDGRAKGPFLADWILAKFPQTEKVGESMRDLEGEEINRAGIVHRLDKETSGALIIAKTQEGYESLKKQFQDRTITKKYLSFLWGELKEEFGTINRPIGRSGGDFRKWSAQRGTRGETREAETYWTRLGNGEVNVRYIENSEAEVDRMEKFTFVEVEPKTGRTHQIRVHFNAVNHPVVGDSLYAPKKPMALGFERLALHSLSVSFATLKGKKLKIVATPPADFAKACENLGVKLP